MSRKFEELRNFLYHHYPELAGANSVRGELYPPPPPARTVAALGSYAQMGGIAATLFGGLIFDRLGAPQPFFVPAMRRNPMPTIIGLTFLNAICSSGLQTGAFEVFVDGELVFSRLEGGGSFPSARFLLGEMEKRGLRSSARSF